VSRLADLMRGFVTLSSPCLAPVRVSKGAANTSCLSQQLTPGWVVLVSSSTTAKP